MDIVRMGFEHLRDIQVVYDGRWLFSMTTLVSQGTWAFKTLVDVVLRALWGPWAK